MEHTAVIRRMAAVARWAALHADLARGVLRGPGGISGWRWRAARGTRAPLFLYSQVAWDDVWQRPQEMARGLARHRPVVYCSPVQIHQAAGPQAGRWQPVRIEGNGRLLVLAPLLLTGEYRASPVRALNRVILTRTLEPLSGAFPWLFLTNTPFFDDLADRMGARCVLYDLIDDFCAFEWAPREGRRRERRLLRRADAILAGTHTLFERFGRQRPDIVFLPSGVDAAKLTRPAPEPIELRSLPRPRLLYVGTLNDRVSGGLINATARAFPEASVVLVGPRRATFHAPPFPPNVIELGLRPHDDLPGFYQHCDAGLMPFADNDAARAVNPVKTLEYLACGLPVISTPVPDVERFYTPPAVVAPPQQWPATLRTMLACDDAQARAERARFAEGRSWSTLVDRVEAMLRALEERAPQ